MTIQYKSLRNQIKEYVATKIRTGELTKGDKLSEVELAKEIGISRTPTREALLQLEADGILQYTPRKGFTVKGFSEKEKNDTFIVVAYLDALAATLSIDCIDEGDILKMEQIADKIDIAVKYEDYPSYVSLQDSFHEVYRQKCENKVVIDMLSNFQKGFIPTIYLNKDDHKLFDACDEMNKEHRKIINFFKEKNTEELFKILSGSHWITRYSDLI